MIIHQPEISVENGDVCVSAVIEPLKPVPDLPGRLWFTFPEQYQPAVTDRSDAFASSLLQFAMYLEEDLEIRGTTSPRLAYGQQQYQDIFHAWFPRQFQPIQVVYERLDDPPACGDRRMVCTAFSGGIDSFYTLWSHLPRNQSIPSARLTHGLFIHGFDIPLSDNKNFSIIAQQYSSMFHRLGITLITARTNALAFWRYRMRWEYVHGGPTIGTAQVLSQSIDRFYLPASRAYTDQSPMGTSPMIDHLLSTETLDVVHHGSERSRIEKLAVLSQWEESCQYLRVCTNNQEPDQIWNCGNCEKCVYTLAMLAVLGVQDRIKTFDKPVTITNYLRWGFAHIHPTFARQIIKAALQRSKPGMILPMLLLIPLGRIRAWLYWLVVNSIPKQTLYRLRKRLLSPARLER